jgi:hypothetical protein
MQMNEICELLEKCGYFSKYQNSKKTLCQGWIRQYCMGPKMDQCKRKIYRSEHNAPPPDDMMPSGLMVSDYFQQDIA